MSGGASDQAGPMTPAHIAVAIVAACGVTRTRPEKVFEAGNQRPRVMAAAACVARLGWDRKAAARALRIHPNRLTPSGLTLAKVETDHLLVVAEALEAHGLTGRAAGPPPVSRPAAAEARPRRKSEEKPSPPRPPRRIAAVEAPKPEAPAQIRRLPANRV